MDTVASGRVAEDIYLIETVCYGMPRFLGAYVIAAEKLALVDCGPTTALPRLLAEIRRLGFRPQDIAYLFISHIHFDHFGGAGSLLPELPQARVVVHQRGARHVINPTALVERTRDMVGEAAMERDGPVLPVPAERLQAVQEGEIIDLGRGHRLRLLHTPGHSNSALCLYDEKLKGLFVGDAAGICFVDDDVILSPAPGGDFDWEVSLASIRRLQAVEPEVLFFPHFGVSRRASLVLKKSESSLKEWGELAERALRQGPEKVGPALKQRAQQDMAPIRDKGAYYQYILGEVMGLTAAGYTRYFTRKAQG